MSSPPVASAGRRALVLGLIGVVALGELYIAWLALHPNVPAGYRAYYIDQSTTCLDKPVRGQYVMGSTVSFLPDDQAGARKLRVCGWDGPAGDGTHSVGTSSLLRFGVTGPTDGLVLRLLVTAIEAPDKRDQRIVLSGNGVPRRGDNPRQHAGNARFQGACLRIRGCSRQARRCGRLSHRYRNDAARQQHPLPLDQAIVGATAAVRRQAV